MKLTKKPFPTVVILLVSKEPAGKLVRLQLALKEEKKSSPTVVNHVDNLNEFAGKLVRLHSPLKPSKKKFFTPVIFSILNEFAGKLVKLQLALK